MIYLDVLQLNNMLKKSTFVVLKFQMKLKRKENNTDKKIEDNTLKIQELNEYSKGKPGRKSQKDKKGIRKRLKKD